MIMKNKSPFDKETDIHENLLKIILQSQKGLTTTELQKISGVSRKTLEKHLSLLASENAIHMNQFGPTRVYYPNKIIKNFKSEKFEIRNKVYYLDLLENQYGKFYLIQEKKKEDSGKLSTKGAILIPFEGLKEFVKAMQNLIR
jgi:predicted transcriptional regulator